MTKDIKNKIIRKKIELLNQSFVPTQKPEDDNRVELLAPAGSFANLRAAIFSGASAVYLGMTQFGARDTAVNFDREMLRKAAILARANNVKVYLTANTLIKNYEIKDFFDNIKYAYELGINGVIIQDPSFIEIVRRGFPGLKIHMSTQSGIMNSLHANIFSGADRINLARELSKENIMAIRNNFSKEIEVFVHGALCVCVSGSCLFSSFIGGRSGNRGKCAQPCRKLYNDKYFLSTKELCLIDKVPELIELGVDSIKIEGRQRMPHYTATTTSNYRKAIDSFYAGKFKIEKKDREELERVFSRGFTQGKFSGEGETMFNPSQASANVEMKNNVYPVELKYVPFERRRAHLDIPEPQSSESLAKKMIVRVYHKKDALVAEKYADIICLDMFDKDFVDIKNSVKKPVYAVTPRIMFDSDISKISLRLGQIKPVGIFAGNLGVLGMNLKLPVILDYNCNCFNDFSVDYYKKLNAQPIISPELSMGEMAEFVNKDVIVFVHGKLRLMTLAHDLKEGKITDEKKFSFYVNKIFNGTEILNEKELGLFNKIKNLTRQGLNQIYIDSKSNGAELEEILNIYRQILDGKTIDASKLQVNYVLGWSKAGVI